MSTGWAVWSEEDALIASGLSEANAKALVDELAKDGHHDVYADSETGEMYTPPDFTTELP